MYNTFKMDDSKTEKGKMANWERLLENYMVK